MSNLHKVTFEAIDFQRDAMLLKELSLHIAALQGTNDLPDRLDILKRMSATAKYHTGADFRVHLVEERDPNAFIFVPDSTSAAPMRPEAVKERLKKAGGIASEKEMFKGSIDLRNGKVSGIYGEIPMDVFFSTAFLKPTPKGNMFAPEEIAAVLIHEFGHGVMYLRYLGGMVISNIVIAEIVRLIQQDADPIIVRDVLKVAEQKTGYKLKDLNTIDKNTNPLVIQQVIMAEMVERIRSDLGTKYYDARAFEFVADQFAARHGGAAWIVTALDRMYRECGYRPLEYSSYMGQFAIGLASQLKPIFAFLIAGAAGAPAAGLILAVGVGFVWTLAIATVITLLAGGDIYDDVPNRFKAMRRELIASSKCTALSTQQRVKIIEDIAMIDKALDGLRENKFGPGFIGNFFAGIFTGKTAQLKFMRQLEELGNNQLFEISNQLQAKE